MKKSVIFAFLFMFVFTLPALAYPDLSECETLEDAYALGYSNKMNEEYIAAENADIPDSTRYMLCGLAYKSYNDNAFIEYYDIEDDFTIQDAYDDGYMTAEEDFSVLRDDLENELQSYSKSEVDTEQLTKEDMQDSYDEGYQAGYSDGKSQYEYIPDETKEESDEITNILILCGLGCVIGFILGRFIYKNTNSSVSKVDYSSIRTSPAHSDSSKPAPRQKCASVDLFAPVSPPVRQPVRSISAEQIPLAQEQQFALDKYNKRNRTDWEVGLDFERLIGYQYEIRGYMVKYIGATSGKEDMGRDLIVSNSVNTYIVQCKRWSRSSQIHEKYIFQLYGTTELYKKQHPNASVTGVFITTAYFSAQAKAAAANLGIEMIEHYSFHQHPLIKCKASAKRYYLPMDSEYDKISVNVAAGDYYCDTVAAAISAGFQSAYQ